MPRRNGPQARASGFDALRDRMPRAIAARLARAGLIAPAGPARPPEPTRIAETEERRDEPAVKRPDQAPGS